MIATEVHRRSISDCNGLLGTELRSASGAEAKDSKRLGFYLAGVFGNEL